VKILLPSTAHAQYAKKKNEMKRKKKMRKENADGVSLFGARNLCQFPSQRLSITPADSVLHHRNIDRRAMAIPFTLQYL